MIDTKEILELIERIYSVEINSQLECLSLARHISEIREEEKSKLPFHINVVSSAARGKLKETAHSLILRDLLQSQQIRDSFIETFTPIIAGKEDKYVVLAEKDRIDVSLEGNKHYIIVENKVNGAQEQESQILRYIKIAKEKVKTENIHVVYLNKDNNEWPSDYSLKDDVESVFDTIKEDNFKVFSYKYDILPWLKKLENETNGNDECFLYSALLQYIDYLEDYLECSKRYDNMNERIKKELIENLKLSECQDITEKINKCNQINTDINSLQNNINELLHDLIFEKWETEINRLNKNAFAKITPYDECKCHELNIEVETYVGKKEIFITDGEASYLWWGIKKNENNSIEEFFEKIDKHFDGVKNEYYLWKKTTYSDGLKELLEIIDLLQSK